MILSECTVCEENSLHIYNIAEFSSRCKQSLQTETIATDVLRFSIVSAVENPLASLARFMQCITVNILYYNMLLSERARSASGLQQVLTLGMKTVIIFIHTPPFGGNENHSQ